MMGHFVDFVFHATSTFSIKCQFCVSANKEGSEFKYLARDHYFCVLAFISDVINLNSAPVVAIKNFFVSICSKIFC